MGLIETMFVQYIRDLSKTSIIGLSGGTKSDTCGDFARPRRVRTVDSPVAPVESVYRSRASRRINNICLCSLVGILSHTSNSHQNINILSTLRSLYSEYKNSTTEETQQTEGSIIICGAGIAGLTLAWWMDRTGWDVLVLEIASGLRDEGYIIDFLGSGYDVTERMGLIHRLEEVQQPVSEVVNVNEDGERVSEMDYELFRQL